MKKTILLTFVLFVITLTIKAQPCFNPSINSPRLNVFAQNSILFCDNNDTEVLSTQVYDSYQWYRQEWWAGPGPNPNPWVAINGASSQTYTINGTDDMLYYFKVIVTLDTCTEETPAILADGYAFGLPYLVANFQNGTYESLGNGVYNVCNGASVLLENGFDQVYGLHTWYKCIPSNIPPVPGDTCIIPGATGDTYTATSSGFYGFWACTEYCPNICLFLGLPSFIQLNFGNWGFCFTGTEDQIENSSLSIYPNPTTSYLFLAKDKDASFAHVRIIDMSGRVALEVEKYDFVEPINVSKLSQGSYTIISRADSGRILRNKLVVKAE